MGKIGTLQESSLHSALKSKLASPGDVLEAEVEGYWIDLHCGDHLVEIQTRSFASIKKKLIHLLERYPVQLVFPVAQEKWVIRLDDDLKTPISRRKSPRHGTWNDLFFELTSFPDLIDHPNFSILVLLTSQEELLCREEASPSNGRRKSWRRKGWRVYDRRLIDILDRLEFTTPSDFKSTIPRTLFSSFTISELSKSLSISRPLAQRMTYCLRKMGLIERQGRNKHGYVYAVTDQQE